jgi:hypothetical protein
MHRFSRPLFQSYHTYVTNCLTPFSHYNGTHVISMTFQDTHARASR